MQTYLYKDISMIHPSHRLQGILCVFLSASSAIGMAGQHAKSKCCGLVTKHSNCLGRDGQIIFPKQYIVVLLQFFKYSVN